MDYKKNYYQILEVSVTASKEEIRAAYRRLAKLYHPDKNAENADVEEKFKLINEANEVLSNDILKHEYDSYREATERWEKSQAEQGAEKVEINPSNKRNYVRTKTVVTETRVYIKGDITVKYRADSKEAVLPSYDKVLDYKIYPTEVLVRINEKNIFPVQDIPLDYLRAYKETDIFTVPLPQPIRCEVISESGKEYFELTLNDIRIKSIKLEGITKHEHQSYGTLKGLFYGYSSKLTYEEIAESVTECFGETGNVERKQEGGFDFMRKEYYYPDCSKYWGNWIQHPKVAVYKPSPQKTQVSAIVPDPGCGLVSWIIVFLAFLIIWPKLFIISLLLTYFVLLIYFGRGIFSSAGRFLPVIGLGLLLLFIISAVRSFTNPGTSYIKEKQQRSSVKTTRTVRRAPTENDSVTTTPDTLITHFLKWQDFEGKSYQGNISISVATLRNAQEMHGQMSMGLYQDVSKIYKTMADHDSAALLYLYKTFDSIKVANKLDEVTFSQVLVSAIQSQPYYLVLDKSCDENYDDDFTRNYLQNCKTDCCIGNEVFGVRSPVEFLSDLKGDCDTRSLLLYQVFKHYNYNVALLTSVQYKHAMIALNFTETTSQPGLFINIGDKKYYMWETTSPNCNYGEVSSNFSNLAFWEISLLNKK